MDTPAYKTDPDAVPAVNAAAAAFAELVSDFNHEIKDGLADRTVREAARDYLDEMVATLKDVEAYDNETVTYALTKEL